MEIAECPHFEGTATIGAQEASMENKGGYNAICKIITIAEEPCLITIELNASHAYVRVNLSPYWPIFQKGHPHVFRTRWELAALFGKGRSRGISKPTPNHPIQTEEENRTQPNPRAQSSITPTKNPNSKSETAIPKQKAPTQSISRRMHTRNQRSNTIQDLENYCNMN